MQRIVVGIVMLPFLPLILFFAPHWVLPLVMALLSALAVLELLGATGFVRNKRVLLYAALFAAGLPPWHYFVKPGSMSIMAMAGIFVLFFLLCAEALCDRERHFGFTGICVVVAAGVIIPLFYSSLVRIMQMPQGRHVIMLPFIAAFLTDTCAYFAGMALGRRRLAPDISPKKTIAGAVGGWIGCVLGMLGYGLIESCLFRNGVSFPLLGLYGLIGGAVGQVGDLSASLIKREAGIKDFGSLFPGHGGILDRFDSLLFTAPAMEILLALLPAIWI